MPRPNQVKSKENNIKREKLLTRISLVLSILVALYTLINGPLEFSEYRKLRLQFEDLIARIEAIGNSIQSLSERSDQSSNKISAALWNLGRPGQGMAEDVQSIAHTYLTMAMECKTLQKKIDQLSGKNSFPSYFVFFFSRKSALEALYVEKNQYNQLCIILMQGVDTLQAQCKGVSEALINLQKEFGNDNETIRYVKAENVELENLLVSIEMSVVTRKDEVKVIDTIGQPSLGKKSNEDKVMVDVQPDATSTKPDTCSGKQIAEGNIPEDRNNDSKNFKKSWLFFSKTPTEVSKQTSPQGLHQKNAIQLSANYEMLSLEIRNKMTSLRDKKKALTQERAISEKELARVDWIIRQEEKYRAGHCCVEHYN